MREYGITDEYEDLEDLEIRLYDDMLHPNVDMGFEIPHLERDHYSRGSTPFEQDLSRFPELFHRYQENYDRYEDANRKFDAELKGTQ